MRTGRPEGYYTEKKTKGLATKLGNLQRQTDRLNDEMAQVLAEADYMKKKEVAFHQTSVEIGEASSWWPVFQCFVLVGVGGAQVWRMEGFFKKRKLV